MKSDRRTFLALAVAAFAAPAVAEAPACYDPASLPLSQKSRRRAVEYAELSPDPARHCRACAFFTTSSGDCGTCQMLGGGPVNGGGACTSFAARTKAAG